MENCKNQQKTKLLKETPKVHVVLVNWNGLENTLECISSLKKTNYINLKIVVIDNGSKNKEATLIKNRFPDVHLIKNTHNEGYCRANNQGIKYAIKQRSKYILLLNNDTVVKSDFLKTLVNFAQKENFKGILTPKILYYKKNIIWAMGGSVPIITSIPKMIGQGRIKNSNNKIIDVDYAPGCALFINTSVIKKTGSLDETYFAYYEDTDLSYRVKKLGYKIHAIPSSIIWHKVSASTNPHTTDKLNPIQSFYLARNGIIFGLKNLNGLKKIVYLATQIILKLPSYLLLKCKGIDSKICYLKGLGNGMQYVFKK